MSIESLFKKRRQIRAAWDQERIPSKELIHDLLKRTLNIAPSKQNLFPFKIHIIEPENEKDHTSIAGICALWPTGSVNNWGDDVLVGKSQGHKKAPWVLIFSDRLCEPNNFVKEHSIRNKCKPEDRFNQVHEKQFRDVFNKGLATVEAGMFIEILTGLCLENDLQCSYIHSYPGWIWNQAEQVYFKEKNKVGFDWDKLPWMTDSPILMMQIGYKADMIDHIASNAVDPNGTRWENKPSIDTLVEYHSA